MITSFLRRTRGRRKQSSSWLVLTRVGEIALAGVLLGALIFSVSRALCSRLLVEAVNGQNADFVQSLLARGADPNTRDDTGYHPPPWYQHIIEAVLHRHSTPPKPYTPPTVLMEAAWSGDDAVVQLLLAHGADVNAKGAPVHALLDGTDTTYSGTPLAEAVEANHVTTAQILLDHGAKADTINRFNEPGLHYAINAGNNAASNHGWTAMSQLLIARGANVNVLLPDGTTPLMQAANVGNISVVRDLLAHGADVNARTNDGFSALTCANGPAILKLLISHGADVNAKSKEGLTVLQSQAVFPEMVRVLKRAGAKR